MSIWVVILVACIAPAVALLVWWLSRRANKLDKASDKVASDLLTHDQVRADIAVAHIDAQTKFADQLLLRLGLVETEMRATGAASEARGIRIAKLEIEAVSCMERVTRLQGENQEVKLQLAALGLQSRLSAQAIEFASDAIIVSDQAGNILVWNRAGAMLFGYSDLEIKGESITRLMPERYRQRHTAGLEKMSHGGNLRLLGRSLMMHGLHKNGKEFPVTITLGGFESGTAKGLYFIAVIRHGSESSTVIL